VDSRVEILKPLHQDSRVVKSRENRSRPSEEDRWQKINGSRELGGSQGESPKIGCSKSRVGKSRGARTTVGSRSREDRWIRFSSCLSRIRRFLGLKSQNLSIRIREIVKSENPKRREVPLWDSH
jgi:hypothetical protein